MQKIREMFGSKRRTVRPLADLAEEQVGGGDQEREGVEREKGGVGKERGGMEGQLQLCFVVICAVLQMSVFHHAMGLVTILDPGFPAEKVDVLDAEEEEVCACVCVCACMCVCVCVCACV